eukprot:8333899-Pyramimonas_sp.AAC.2
MSCRTLTSDHHPHINPQVNCKPQPDNLKNGYFPKCRDLFMAKAQWAREAAVLPRPLPSMDALGDLLRPLPVRKYFYETFTYGTHPTISNTTDVSFQCALFNSLVIRLRRKEILPCSVLILPHVRRDICTVPVVDAA